MALRARGMRIVETMATCSESGRHQYAFILLVQIVITDYNTGRVIIPPVSSLLKDARIKARASRMQAAARGNELELSANS